MTKPVFPFIDSHCHLDFPSLADDLPAVLERADAAGVKLMLTISTRVRQFERLQKIVEQHERIYCSIGTHPHYAAQEPDVSVDELVEIAQHPKVIGIGEAGLDYHYDRSPRDLQEAGFRIHIEAARRTGLPLIIHSRSAEEDTAAILEDEMGKGAFKPLLHCFTSDISLARRGLAIGAYVSFSGILTFNSAAAIRETAKIVPMDRLLVETDAPYLAPVPYRGKPNEPAYAVETLRYLAKLKGLEPAQCAKQTNSNFFTLFNKIKPSAELLEDTA